MTLHRFVSRSKTERKSKERLMEYDPISPTPCPFLTGKGKVGQKLNSETSLHRRSVKSAGSCAQKKGDKNHASERIKRKRETSFSPRRTKLDVRSVQRKIEPERSAGEGASHVDSSNVTEILDSTKKQVRWAVPHPRSSVQPSTSQRDRCYAKRETSGRSWRLESRSTKEESPSESNSSDEAEDGEIRKDKNKAQDRVHDTSDVSFSSSDEDNESQGGITYKAALPLDTEDEVDDTWGGCLNLNAQRARSRDDISIEERILPGSQEEICAVLKTGEEAITVPRVSVKKVRESSEADETGASDPSRVTVAAVSGSAEPTASVHPEENELKMFQDGLLVASGSTEELRNAIQSIGGETSPSTCFSTEVHNTAIADAEYAVRFQSLQAEQDAIESVTISKTVYDDINLVMYADYVEPCPMDSANIRHVCVPVAPSYADQVKFPIFQQCAGFADPAIKTNEFCDRTMSSEAVPPPETRNDAFGQVGDQSHAASSDSSLHSDDFRVAQCNETSGVLVEGGSCPVEPVEQALGTNPDNKVCHGSPEGSVRPQRFDGIPLSTVKNLITCPSCSRVFNRAPLCQEYLLQLNRPVQCLCGCVLCTICYRGQGGCQRHGVVSKHGAVNYTANVLADLPEVESVGVWDLEREDSDRIMPKGETEQCVQIMLAEGTPAPDELKQAFQTVLQNPANDMSFTYWDNQVLPEEDAHRYVCIPHVPGFWDHMLVGKWCPATTQEVIGPDLLLPRLFDVDMGGHSFHWCCFVLKEQILLVAWCRKDNSLVVPLIDSSLRGIVSHIAFRRMMFYLRTWIEVQYRWRKDVEGVKRNVHTVLDCKPSEGPSIAHVVARLAAQSGMEKAEPTDRHLRRRPLALDTDVFFAKNAAAAALFDYRPRFQCDSQTLYLNVAEEFSNYHCRSDENLVTQPICTSSENGYI
ncbi:hypothetical protein OJAV_G00234810 [Oryzias javanicus]|uniref:Uncharacterized protein n=1 Tax=Oryzias javanicus TaxID=123683 RepID=A0A437BYN0_ORYJA|nr:hypothetical protein OJAV_G00234810 [Oryzias javanicus]